MALISTLGGALYTMLRAEASNHAEQIKDKASEGDLLRLESRWQSELHSVRDGSEKLVAKLEARHERDLEQLYNRITDQMRNMEINILSQLRLTLDVIENKRKD
jgi:hypothetical protein